MLPVFFLWCVFFCDSFLFFYYTFFFGGMRCSQNLFSFCTKHKSLCAQEDGIGIVFFLDERAEAVSEGTHLFFVCESLLNRSQD